MNRVNIDRDVQSRKRIAASRPTPPLDAPSNTERLYLAGDAYSSPAVLVKESGNWNIYYLCRDYLGSITQIANADGSLKQELSYDAWGRLRNPSTQAVYAPGSEPALFLGRGYTGHEHLTWFGLINMNARLYDPALGRFLSPDPYVQDPNATQNFNRYTYALNNPLMYTDPDGEIVWLIPVIVAAVFAVGNTVAHAIRGDIDNFWDFGKYFLQGAVTGFALGAAWQFAPMVPFIGEGLQTAMTLYALGQGTLGAAGMVGGVIEGGWNGLGRGAEAFLGNFYLDENNFFGGVWKGFLRHTWEMPQSFVGHGYTQVRNTAGRVDRIDYLGGATFATRYNSEKSWGISLGSHVNISYSGTERWNKRTFDDFVVNNPLYMHEYGHTIDSKRWGPLYLFYPGIPSLISAATSEQVAEEPDGVYTHDFRHYEMSANKRASRYFGNHYGVDWNSPFRSRTIETFYPRKRR